MNIGTAAREAGLPTKTVRYYADIGLVTPRRRGENGYREYGLSEVMRLRFVRRARAFGFSVEECRELLRLFADRNRRSSDVKRLTLERVERLDEQLRELKALRDDLQHLADACKGDADPDCPILNSLAGEPVDEIAEVA